MENKELRLKDLRGSWVSYYSKIDGTLFSSGVPQYRTIIKRKRVWGGWETVHDNANKENTNFILAKEVQEFFWKMGQLKRVPNGYGTHLDLEGTMCVSSQLLDNYLGGKK